MGEVTFPVCTATGRVGGEGGGGGCKPLSCSRRVLRGCSFDMEEEE